VAKSKTEEAKPEPKWKERPRRKTRRRRRRRLILCLVIVLIIAGFMLLQARLPRLVERALEKAYAVDASVGGASLSWPGAVTVSNIELRRASDTTRLGSIGRAEVSLRLRDLLAGRIRPDSLDIEDVQLLLRKGDEEIRRGKGSPSDYPIKVTRLTTEVEGPWTGSGRGLVFSGVAFALQPQASGCLSVEGSGWNSAVGPFRLSGVLGGDVLDTRVALSFSEVPLGAELREVLPKPVAEAVENLDPVGGAALTAVVSVPRDGKTSDGPEFEWRMTLRGVSISVPRLDQRLTDVRASIEGSTTEFTVSEATANYRSALLSCNAHSVPSAGSIGLRLSARARDVSATPDLLPLLPPRAREAIEKLNVSGGQLDIDLEMRLPSLSRTKDGQPPRPDFVRADVSLRNCSATPDIFPYPLSRITGRVSVGLDKLVVTSPIVGWHGDGSVKLTGTIALRRSAGSDIVVEARELAVDDALTRAISAVGKPVAEAWNTYSLEGGTLDALISSRRPPGGKKEDTDWSVRLSFDGCSASYRGYPYALTGLTGGVDIRPGRVFVKNLTGWHGRATVRVSGWADIGKERKDLRLQIRGTNVPLNEDLAAGLPAEARKTWDRFRPTGAADIEVVVSTPTREGKAADVRVDAALKGCHAQIPAGDKAVPLTDVKGRLEVHGNVIRLTGLSATCLGGRATTSAIIVRAGDVTKLQGELVGGGFSVEEILGLLSEDSAQRAGFLHPSGTLNLPNLRFDVIQHPGRPLDIEYECAGELRNAQVAIPTVGVGGEDWAPGGELKLSEITGRFDINNERGRAAAGTFKLDQLRVLNGTMRNVTGRMRKTGPVLTLEQVRGEMYGGRIEADFRGAADLLFFNTQVRVIGMDMARVASETGLTGERVWGYLEGGLQLSGERVARPDGDATWRLTGGGSFQIDRANLGKTPLVRSVLSYKTFLLGEEPVVRAAKMDFEIDSTRLKLHKIALVGSSGSTRGVGVIDYGGDRAIELYFYRRREGSLLPRVPVIHLIGKGLNWAVDKIQNQMVIVKVTGTLKEPKVTPVVLKAAREQVQRYIIFNLWEQERERAARRDTDEALADERDG